MIENEIIIELKNIKQDLYSLILKIEQLEKLINYDQQTTIKQEEIDASSSFSTYLSITKNLSQSSIRNYFGSLRVLKEYLKKYEKYTLNSEIYEITDLKILLLIKDKLTNNKFIKEKNKKSHNSISAALNNYLNYIANKGSNIDSFELDE